MPSSGPSLLAVQDALNAVRSTAKVYVEAIDAAETAIVSAYNQLAADLRTITQMGGTMYGEHTREPVVHGPSMSTFEQANENIKHAATWCGSIHAKDTVLLDVGGVHYKTSRATLRAAPGSMLDAMFSGRHDDRLIPDGGGRIFIDRDGNLFKYVLEFLRSPETWKDIADMDKGQQLKIRREADFFGLEEAMFPEQAELRLARKATKIVVLGGWDGSDSLNTTEIFDLATLTFSSGPRLCVAREFCTGVMMNATTVLVIGGHHDSIHQETTEVLDIAAGSSVVGPSMSTRRTNCAAAMLDSDRLMVLGGRDTHNHHACTEVLNLSTMMFAPGPQMSTRRRGAAAVMLDACRLVIVGGHDLSVYHDTTEVLDLTTMTFNPGPRMHVRRGACAAAMLDARHFIVVGGRDECNHHSTTEILDLCTMTFAPGPRMAARRRGCGIARLGTERLFIVGGSDGTSDHDTTEVLNLTTMTFAPGPRLRSRRHGISVVNC